MLQGFGETGDVWAPVAAVLVEDRTVLVPTFEAWACGHDKKTQAYDIAKVMDTVKIEKATLVTYDIGKMVGHAFAAQFPARDTLGRY